YRAALAARKSTLLRVQQLHAAAVEVAAGEAEVGRAVDGDFGERQHSTPFLHVAAVVALRAVPEADVDVGLVGGDDAAELHHLQRPLQVDVLVTRWIVVGDNGMDAGAR